MTAVPLPHTDQARVETPEDMMHRLAERSRWRYRVGLAFVIGYMVGLASAVGLLIASS